MISLLLYIGFPYLGTWPIAISEHVVHGKVLKTKLENLTYANIYTILGATLQTWNVSRDFSKFGAPFFADNKMRTMMTTLQMQLPGALVGVTSITDPRGYTVRYEYDGFNRLKAVRDGDDNLVTDYEYRYKNQQ